VVTQRLFFYSPASPLSFRVTSTRVRRLHQYSALPLLQQPTIILNIAMKSTPYILLFWCCLAAATGLHAQQDSVPAWQPLLPTLSEAQQEKVLDYAHHLGAFYGKKLEATIKLLSAADQHRVFQYIQVLKNTGKPALTTVQFTRDTLPFGQIEEGYILLDSFVVVNTGNAPYFIYSTKSSCDCTVVEYPTFPVMPGDSATIHLTFESANKAGHARPSIIVYDNSSPNQRHILYLDGYITPKKAVKVIRH
jgi:hypothetical protein